MNKHHAAAKPVALDSLFGSIVVLRENQYASNNQAGCAALWNMKYCVGLLKESARVPYQMWHSPRQSVRMTGNAIDFHRLGVMDHGRDDDPASRTAAKAFGVEPARGGLPQQRLVGKSLVRRA